MAKKKQRERYTERARGGSGTPAAGGEGGGGGGIDPILLVAVGGLAVAVVLALGFLLGRGGDEQSASAPQPTAPAAEESAAESPEEAQEDAASGAEEAPADDAEAAPEEEDAAPPDPGPDTSGRANAYPDGPEDQGLDPETTAYFATIETDYGPIELELWPEAAPEHVNSFVFLAREGFFDGLVFHRVVPGFVIQGGDPTGTGTGGPGYNVPAEFNADDPIPHRAGSLAMARSGDPDSAGSQFYIVTEDGPSASNLDGQYTNFGHVISGMGAVLSVRQGDRMNSVTIEERPIEERVVSPDDLRAGELPDNGLE